MISISDDRITFAWEVFMTFVLSNKVRGTLMKIELKMEWIWSFINCVNSGYMKSDLMRLQVKVRVLRGRDFSRWLLSTLLSLEEELFPLPLSTSITSWLLMDNMT